MAAKASAIESSKKGAKAAPKVSSKEISKSASKKPKSLMPKLSTKAATKATSKVLPQEVEAAQAPSEDEDEDMEIAEGSSAAAGTATAMPKVEEMSTSPMTPKNFRNHPDMENFFRFIYENDLRIEALEIIDQIIVERARKRQNKKHSTHA